MFTARNFHTLYPLLINSVTEAGISSAPRGKPVIEFPFPLVWTIRNPNEWGSFIPGRRLNPFFALAEVVWMWSGKGGSDFITYYNQSMANFLDAGVPYFNAAYGRRVRHAGYDERPFRDTPSPMSHGQLPAPVEVDQLQFVISKLQQDEFTRQAAVSLWDPIKDNFHQSKDYPCNNMVYFSHREGKLNVTVVIRSNDVVWGVPYNMIQFSHLQALIAGALNLKMGWFTVMCNNLHIYDGLYPETRKLVVEWAENYEQDSYRFSIYAQKEHAMEWDLAQFDSFVSTVWERIETDLRKLHYSIHDNGPVEYKKKHGAGIVIQLHRLERAFEAYDMPKYWQAVFRTMLLFHVRKAKDTPLYLSELVKLPESFQWLIEDFDKKA